MGQLVLPPAARRRPARRARNAVVSAVVTLLVLNLALIAYVRRHPGFRDPVFDAKIRDLTVRFAGSGDATRVVVLGSSRTAAAIEPRALETALEAQTGRPAVAYNLGLQGNGPVSQLVHYRRFTALGIRPDLLVVEVLPAGYAWKGDRPYDATILRPDRMTREELDVVCCAGFPTDETRLGWWENTLNPWFGFRFQLVGRVRSKWLPPGVPRALPNARDPGGWAPWDPFPADVVSRRVAEVKTIFEPHLRVLRFAGPHADAFDDLLRGCAADGVPVVVMVPPEGSDYRTWYPPAAEADLAAYLDRLRATHGVPVVDARGWLPDEAFADGHHVLRTFARPYTERLAREVIAAGRSGLARGEP